MTTDCFDYCYPMHAHAHDKALLWQILSRTKHEPKHDTNTMTVVTVVITTTRTVRMLLMLQVEEADVTVDETVLTEFFLEEPTPEWFEER